MPWLARARAELVSARGERRVRSKAFGWTRLRTKVRALYDSVIQISCADMMLGTVRGYPEIGALFRRFPARMNWNWLVSMHFSSDFEASRHMIVRGSTLSRSHCDSGAGVSVAFRWCTKNPCEEPRSRLLKSQTFSPRVLPFKNQLFMVRRRHQNGGAVDFVSPTWRGVAWLI
jgi:hypothetical protein